MIRPRAHSLTVAALGCAVLLLAACGGEEGETPAEKDPWAEAEYKVVDPTAPRGIDEEELTPEEKLARYILNPDDNELRMDVAARAASWGEEALPAAPLLRDYLLNEGGHAVDTAAYVLAHLGPKGFPYIHEAHQSKHAASRFAIAKSLGSLGPDALPALDDLHRLLRDGDEHVRGEAVKAIGAIGPKASASIERISHHARGDESTKVRAFALRALMQIAPTQKATLELLEQAARDELDFGVRRVALLAFAELSKDSGRVVDLARAALKVPALRLDAATLMVERGADEPAMVEAYADRVRLRGPPTKTLAAAEMLVLTGPNGRKAAIPLLIHTLDWAPNDKHKLQAVALLVKTADAGRADPHVKEVLEVHADPESGPASVAKACRAALAALRLAAR